MKFNILIFSVFLLLSACSSRQVEKPLIKTDEFLEQAKKDIDRTVELGPKAVIETDEFKKAQENKRRNITSEETRSFIGVGTKFENLKQIEKVIAEVKDATNSFKVFGMYKKGKVVKG